MREILFKGFRENTKEWVKGDLLREKDVFGNIITYIYQIRGNAQYAKWEVTPETVCQYIGLNDRTTWEQLSENEKEKFLAEWNFERKRKNRKEDWNGRKIFEGDIVGRYSAYRGEWNYGVVKYGEFNCSCCDGVYGWYFKNEDIRDIELYEVKGNIFENSELLEGGELK